MERPPWVMPVLLVFVLLPTAVGLWSALAPILKALRMRAAEKALLPTDHCVACKARDLERMGPEVIRCRQCGILSGIGLSAWQRQRRLGAIELLTPPARRMLAVEKLREAQLNVLSAVGFLDESASASFLDIAGLSFDRGREKQQALGSAVWQLRLAHQLATEAAETIQANLGLAKPLALEQSALLLSLDTAWLSDGFAVNIAVHTRIATVRKQSQALHDRIEQLLGHLNEQTT